MTPVTDKTDSVEEVSLLPCPFCGSELTTVRDYDGDSLYAHPDSDNCVLSGTSWDADEFDVIAWNRRSIANTARETVDEEELDTILAVGRNEQSGRVTNYELKELVRVYRAALTPSRAGAGADGLRRAASALLGTLWQGANSSGKTIKENWAEMERRWPASKWLQDELNAHPTTQPNTAAALAAELREYAEKCGDPTNEMLRDAAQFIALTSPQAGPEDVTGGQVLNVAHRIQSILAEKLTVDEGEIVGVGPASYKIARLFKPAPALTSPQADHFADAGNMVETPQDGAGEPVAFTTQRMLDDMGEPDTICGTMWPKAAKGGQRREHPPLPPRSTA